MKNNVAELQVAALQNGTVIDHIPTDKLFTIVSLLGLLKKCFQGGLSDFSLFVKYFF